MTARALLQGRPDFRRLFCAQAASLLGDRMSFVALPFAVLAIGGSALDIGLVGVAQTVPFAAFALVGGVWADRLPRQRLMLASDVVRLGVQAASAALLLTATAEVWHLVVLAALFGVADAFFSPAMVGLVPAVAGAGNVQQANALLGVSMSGAMIAGPALAGVVIALSGPGEAIAVDAATYAVSAAFLARMPAVAVARDAVRSFGAELADGWREVRSRTWVWAFMGAISAYCTVVLPSIFVLGPVLAERELDGAASWGLITALFGVGSLAGRLLLLRVRPRHPLRTAATALLLASGQALFIGSGLPALAIGGLELLAGIGVALFFTLWEITLQEQIPATSISRVSSYDYLVSVGLMPLGLGLAGPAADLLGLHATLYAMSAIGIAVAAALLCVPAVRGVSRPAAAVPGTA